MAKLTLYDNHREAVIVAGLIEVNDRWHVAVVVPERHLRRAPRQDAAGSSAVDGIAHRPPAYVDAQDREHVARRARNEFAAVQREARVRGSDDRRASAKGVQRYLLKYLEFKIGTCQPCNSRQCRCPVSACTFCRVAFFQLNFKLKREGPSCRTHRTKSAGITPDENTDSSNARVALQPRNVNQSGVLACLSLTRSQTLQDISLAIARCTCHTQVLRRALGCCSSA